MRLLLLSEWDWDGKNYKKAAAGGDSWFMGCGFRLKKWKFKKKTPWRLTLSPPQQQHNDRSFTLFCFVLSQRDWCCWPKFWDVIKPSYENNFKIYFSIFFNNWLWHLHLFLLEKTETHIDTHIYMLTSNYIVLKIFSNAQQSVGMPWFFHLAAKGII